MCSLTSTKEPLPALFVSENSYLFKLGIADAVKNPLSMRAHLFHQKKAYPFR